MHRKIIAQNITNLTDARYFAAWGVDYLSFNLNPNSAYAMDPDSIKEIKDWIEGPQILTESNSIDFLEISDGHILDYIYRSMPVGKECFYRISTDQLQGGLESGNYIIRPALSQLATLGNIPRQVLAQCNLYLDISRLPVDSFEKWPAWNLAVQGGEEEKTGVKSFDELDELYEYLIEEN